MMHFLLERHFLINSYVVEFLYFFIAYIYIAFHFLSNSSFTFYLIVAGSSGAAV